MDNDADTFGEVIRITKGSNDVSRKSKKKTEFAELEDSKELIGSEEHIENQTLPIECFEDIFYYTKRKAFSFFSKVFGKQKCIALSDTHLYICCSSNGALTIKRIIELKRLFKVTLQYSKADTHMIFNFFNQDYDPFKPPVLKTYTMDSGDSHEFISKLYKKCSVLGIKMPTIEENKA